MSGKKKLNILITAAGSPGVPGLLAACRQGLPDSYCTIGVDLDSDAIGRYLCDEFYQVPPTTSAEYIPRLLELCNEHAVDILFPNEAMAALASHREQFAAVGTTVLVSNDARTLALIEDKAALYGELRVQGIAVPDYAVAASADELVTAVTAWLERHGRVCLKPARAEGSRGFMIVQRERETMQELLDTRGRSRVVSVPALRDIIAGDSTIPELLVMEYLPGTEYSVDALFCQGELRVAVPRCRERIAQGLSVAGTIERNPELNEVTARIGKYFNLDYCVNLQFIANPAGGDYRLIDLNPRVGGTLAHTVAAGANLPCMAIQQAMGRSLPECIIEDGLRMHRYWAEAYRREEE